MIFVHRFVILVQLIVLFTVQTAAAQTLDAKKLLAESKKYVGSEVCRECHLEHYDAWKRTLHSKMLQDVSKNEDVLVTEIDTEAMKKDFLKIESSLKLPVDQIYYPKREEIKYTIGSQWKQRYLVQKDGIYYIAPTQFNIDTSRWVNYHEKDWDKRPWLLKCGGCHATGVNLDKESFEEPGVGCEACHGPGSHHAALPATETFKKRATIVNPSKLTGGVAVQICGSCHNRGTSTKHKGSGWAVGYKPGRALESYYKSIQLGDKHLYSTGLSKGHHQQYIDWKRSKHADSGVSCLTCHVVHQLGNPQFHSKTKVEGDKLCVSCHEQVAAVGAHSVHSFGNCANCHMPRVAKSAESGDIRSHLFTVLLPKDTLETNIPNSCQTCHKHKDEDLKDLQRRWDALTTRQTASGKAVNAGQ